MRRFVMAIGFVAFVCLVVWLYSRWTDPDRDYKLVNFTSAWFPFAVSVFAAFIPDFERAEKMRPVWRIGIVALGLAYSIVLWKQQGINLEAGKKDQDTVVRLANNHTDKAVQGANDHTDTEIGMVRDDLKKVSKHSDEQVAGVRSDVKSLADQFNKGASDLKDSISKVGKPDPPVRAQLSVRLVQANAAQAALYADKDGVYAVPLSISNNSVTAVHEVDIWIDLCGVCEFVKEDGIFSRPTGLRDETRYIHLPLLNPHISLATQTISLKMKTQVLNMQTFQVGFRYSCEACVDAPPEQIVTVKVRQP